MLRVSKFGRQARSCAENLAYALDQLGYEEFSAEDEDYGFFVSLARDMFDSLSKAASEMRTGHDLFEEVE